MSQIILILTWIITLLLIIFSFIINPTSYFANGTIILGWLLFALQLSWNKSEWFYLATKSIWFKIINPECVWNMTVEFTGEYEENIFNLIDKTLLHNSNCKITYVSNTRRLYKVGTLSFEIVISPNVIRLDLNDLEVSYRRSTQIIKVELGQILEELARSLKSSDCEYHLDIIFKDTNPYYGVYLRRLNINNINTFKVQFNVENEKITVNKNKISVSTDSLQSLRNFSEEYLTISPR